VDCQGWGEEERRTQEAFVDCRHASNLLLLGYYKYTNFFLGYINAVAGMNLTLAEIILPLGISFFYFYPDILLVDTYQSKVKEYNFIHYMLFVTRTFPSLNRGGRCCTIRT